MENFLNELLPEVDGKVKEILMELERIPAAIKKAEALRGATEAVDVASGCDEVIQVHLQTADRLKRALLRIVIKVKTLMLIHEHIKTLLKENRSTLTRAENQLRDHARLAQLQKEAIDLRERAARLAMYSEEGLDAAIANVSPSILNEVRNVVASYQDNVLEASEVLFANRSLIEQVSASDVERASVAQFAILDTEAAIVHGFGEANGELEAYRELTDEEDIPEDELNGALVSFQSIVTPYLDNNRDGAKGSYELRAILIEDAEEVSQEEREPNPDEFFETYNRIIMEMGGPTATAALHVVSLISVNPTDFSGLSSEQLDQIHYQFQGETRLNEEILLEISKHPNASPFLIRNIIAALSNWQILGHEVLCTVVGHPNADLSVHQALMERPDILARTCPSMERPDVRDELVVMMKANEDNAIKIFDYFVNNIEKRLVFVLALKYLASFNSGASEVMLNKIGEWFINSGVTLSNRDQGTELKEKLLRAIAEDPCAGVTIVADLFTQGPKRKLHPDRRNQGYNITPALMAAIRNPYAPKEFREEFQHSDNFTYLGALLDNPSTETSILNNFAHKLMDKGMHLQVKLVEHPNASIFTLEYTAKNSNSSAIQEQAKQRLETLKAGVAK